MSWELLESGRVNEKSLTLYRSASDYMIRVDGWELMNSRWSRSEKTLAQIAGWCAPKINPRILIGGLGLGFTLAAFMKEFESRGKLTVVEQSTDVIRWYRRYLRDGVLGKFDDSQVSFVNGHIQGMILESGNPFDLIVLDVDNGPEALCGESNSVLYKEKGLRQIRSCLTDNGALLLWSSFESEEFEKSARKAGYQVYCWPVDVGLREHRHYIYCCFNSENPEFQAHEFLQAVCYDGYAGDYCDDISFCSKWLGNASHVLEIGIGTGRLALNLSKGRNYYGIDTSAPMLHQILRKKGNLPIQVKQESMFNFALNARFERIMFPFRVLPYATNDREVIDALNCARSHLSPGGRILINMIDFDKDFISRWQNQSVSYDFIGPDGKVWHKTDVMRFVEGTMCRKIEFRRNGHLMCENEDNLMWMSSNRLKYLCEKAHLSVTNIWPAYEWTAYSGSGEYVLEACA